MQNKFKIEFNKVSDESKLWFWVILQKKNDSAKLIFNLISCCAGAESKTLCNIVWK